jgi:hypothetical protein
MQRQSDNRLHQITTVRPTGASAPQAFCTDIELPQAMAFMSRYRKLMQTNATYLPPAQIMEEVDYNFGRAFQSLGRSRYWRVVRRHADQRRSGILPLAVKHYRQTLESISKRMKEQKATGDEVSPVRRFTL